MNRRGFISGLLAVSAAAVAAEFGVPEEVGEEIQAELKKDLNRTVIQVPGKIFTGHDTVEKVWQSSASVRKVWKDHILTTLNKTEKQATVDHLAPKVDRMLDTMVHALDNDLRSAEVDTSSPLIVGTPKIRVLQPEFGSFGRKKPILELSAGVKEVEGLLGTKKYEAGYIAQKIVV